MKSGKGRPSKYRGKGGGKYEVKVTSGSRWGRSAGTGMEAGLAGRELWQIVAQGLCLSGGGVGGREKKRAGGRWRSRGLGGGGLEEEGGTCRW